MNLTYHEERIVEIFDQWHREEYGSHPNAQEMTEAKDQLIRDLEHLADDLRRRSRKV